MRVQGKVKRACDLMVFGDDDQPCYAWDDAARKVSLTVYAMRLALERQHVRRYLQDQRQVFRAAICAANPRRLATIRDQNDNWAAAVRAIQVLEQIDDDPATAAARNRAPGVVINIVAAVAQPTQTNADDIRTIEHE